MHDGSDECCIVLFFFFLANVQTRFELFCLSSFVVGGGGWVDAAAVAYVSMLFLAAHVLGPKLVQMRHDKWCPAYCELFIVVLCCV